MKIKETTKIPLSKQSQLIQLVADTLHPLKHSELPSLCLKLGLEPGENSEAHNSKKNYVKTRLKKVDESTLLNVSRRVSAEFANYSLSEFLALLDEEFDEIMVSEITRSEILQKLNAVSLFGDLNIQSKLAVVFPEFVELWQYNEGMAGLMGKRYDVGSNSELLRQAGALECSVTRFFQLLELLVSPNVRKGDEQANLVAELNKLLRVDGFVLQREKLVSGHPVFSIAKLAGGVTGTPKNLIFAANGPKPELVFADAINNDIRIVKNEEFCLIFDRPIGTSGLSKGDLLAWWRDLQQLDDVVEAWKSLVKRLYESLDSQGEKNFFTNYYKLFKRKDDDFPMLIPQVYLHYDPYTIKQLAGQKRLPRQRMDFLILFSDSTRVVIEVDGKQHFSKDDKPSLPLYSEMMSADRDLRLAGYEIYRFGADELVGPESDALIQKFLLALMTKHSL